MRAARLIRRLYVGSGVRNVLPLRVKTALRAVWIRVARTIGYPISSPLVSRPPLRPQRQRMRLSHVLLACDVNPEYLDFWPSARRAWTEIAEIEPVLVLVAAEDAVPADIAADGFVVTFPPLPDVHTTFQAQCIRLLYPALLDSDGAVIIADIDLYPLKASYFHDPIAKLDAEFFVRYRDVRLNFREVPIAYNAAAPATWAEIFDVRSVDDARARLTEWASRATYDGRRGWEGWYTDQQVLYERLAGWSAARERLWTLDDAYCGFKRLDRLELQHEDGLEPHRIRGLRAQEYSDYNCLVPYGEHREVNDLVLDLALEAARARPEWPRRALARA